MLEGNLNRRELNNNNKVYFRQDVHICIHKIVQLRLDRCCQYYEFNTVYVCDKYAY